MNIAIVEADSGLMAANGASGAPQVALIATPAHQWMKFLLAGRRAESDPSDPSDLFSADAASAEHGSLPG